MKATARALCATLSLASIPASAADLPMLKPGPVEVEQLPHCRSLFPAPFTWLWSCDPFHLSAGTNDRSQSHPAGTVSTPSAPSGPSDPGNGGSDPGNGGDGCGGHHDHDGGRR